MSMKLVDIEESVALVFCDCGEKLSVNIAESKAECDNCGSESDMRALEKKFNTNEKELGPEWTEQVRKTKAYVKAKFDKKYGDILGLTSKIKLLPKKKRAYRENRPTYPTSIQSTSSHVGESIYSKKSSLPQLL